MSLEQEPDDWTSSTLMEPLSASFESWLIDEQVTTPPPPDHGIAIQTASATSMS